MTASAASNSPDQEPDPQVPVPKADGNNELAPEGGQVEATGFRLPAELVELLPQELLDSMPQEIRDSLRSGNIEMRGVSASLSMRQEGRFDVIGSQITGQHITDVIAIQREELNYTDRQSERETNERKEEWRIFAALAAFGILITFGICALASWRVPEFLPQIVTGSIGTGAGLLGGYGIGLSRRR